MKTKSSSSKEPAGQTRDLIHRHLAPALKFLTVGGAAFVVDYLCFNLLVFSRPWPGHYGVMFNHPLWAKLIAIAIASLATYIGNKWWTFRSRQSRTTTSRIGAFIALNVVAMGLQELCLAFSRYALGLNSWLSDNISGTLIGQALATVFRYITYRRWVFPDDSQAMEVNQPEDRPVPTA